MSLNCFKHLCPNKEKIEGGRENILYCEYSKKKLYETTCEGVMENAVVCIPGACFNLSCLAIRKNKIKDKKCDYELLGL